MRFRLIKKLSKWKPKIREFVISYYVNRSKSYLDQHQYQISSTTIPRYFLNLWRLPADQEENLMMEIKYSFNISLSVLDYIYCKRFNRILGDRPEDVDEATETLTVFDQIIQYIIKARDDNSPVIEFDIFDFDNYQSIATMLENNKHIN